MKSEISAKITDVEKEVVNIVVDGALDKMCTVGIADNVGDDEGDPVGSLDGDDEGEELGVLVG